MYHNIMEPIYSYNLSIVYNEIHGYLLLGSKLRGCGLNTHGLQENRIH